MNLKLSKYSYLLFFSVMASTGVFLKRGGCDNKADRCERVRAYLEPVTVQLRHLRMTMTKDCAGYGQLAEQVRSLRASLGRYPVSNSDRALKDNIDDFIRRVDDWALELSNTSAACFAKKGGMARLVDAEARLDVPLMAINKECKSAL